MKYFLLFLGLFFLVAMAILYFQVIVSVSMQVPFFSTFVDMRFYMLYLILLALCCGIFLTLGIKGILAPSDRIDDDFDL